MKTKVLLTMLSLLLVLLFAACEEESGNSEDYAGTWYGYWLTGDYVKVDLNDDDYTAYYYDYGSWEPSAKGDVEKSGDNSVVVETTHYYYYGWVSTYEYSTGTYSVSEDGSTLSLYITYTTSDDFSYPGYVTLYDTND